MYTDGGLNFGGSPLTPSGIAGQPGVSPAPLTATNAPASHTTVDAATGQPTSLAAPAGQAAGTSTVEAPVAADAAPKKRKARAPRIPFRPMVDAAGVAIPDANRAKLTALPEDYSAKQHLPLGKEDFTDEAMFYDWQASQAQKRADRFARQAAQIRTLGGTPEERKNKQKALKLAEQMKEMEKTLRAQMGPEEYEKFRATLAG